MNNKTKNKIIIVTALIAVIAISFWIFFTSQLKPVTSESEVVNFTVSENDNLSTITNKLYEKEIIKSKTVSKLYGKLQGINNFVLGSFEIDKSWPLKDILNHLTTPTNAISNEATVVLIEGYWAKDIAKALSEKLDVTADELINLWNDEDYIKTLMSDYPVLTDDLLNSELKVKLEGYLSPNTYNFFIDSSADQITRKLLNQTQLIYDKYKEGFDKSEYSIHELFTLASITQYESGKYDDDLIIAGIWYNRLNLGMRLESSVTVCYSLYEYTNWNECEKNTQIDSPYNTYRNAGIPIGPILNPGEMSIKATLNPQQSDYLFFIADVYGDNTVYYAKTFEEHQANINKYLRK